MEPGRDDRDHRSLFPTCLTCGVAGLCERCEKWAGGDALLLANAVKKQRMTWERALRGCHTRIGPLDQVRRW